MYIYINAFFFFIDFMRNLAFTLNCCLLVLVQLFLANQEQSNRDVDKDFWKSILDLIPYEVIQCLNPRKPIDLSRMYQILVKLFSSAFWMNIPEDILMQIFLRLPVTSLIHFCIFSKDCYKMISSTRFIKQQLKLAIERLQWQSLFGWILCYSRHVLVKADCSPIFL